MSALYPILSNDVSVATNVDGKALSNSADILARFARDAGVTPLSDFVSSDSDDYGILYDADIEPPTATWFSAAQGLVTVRALLGVLTQRAHGDEALLDDLSALEQVLIEADARGADWHLAIDI
jgi:hypothetical protein